MPDDRQPKESGRVGLLDIFSAIAGLSTLVLDIDIRSTVILYGVDEMPPFVL